MRYRLKKGVVLFSVCGKCFLFPSREAGNFPPMLLSVTEELASVLSPASPAATRELSPETRKKLQRFAAVGIIEEYQK